jgi:hypothetical protein
MFGVLSLIEGFLFEHFVLLTEFRMALGQAGPLFVSSFRRVPHMLTVRAKETPRPWVLVGEHGLGPMARWTLDVNDPLERRNRHRPNATATSGGRGAVSK